MLQEEKIMANKRVPQIQ
jgi:hypothetical protein